VWIEKAKTLPKADLEREVAAVSPYVAKRESVRAVSIDRYILKLEISMKLKRELARAQTLESNRKKKSVNFEEMLEEVVKFYLEHKDPLVKAERIVGKKNWGKSSGTGDADLSPERGRAFGYPCKSVGRMADLSQGQVSEENSGAGAVVTVARKPITRKIPANIFHQVQTRDRGRCAYKSLGGKVCGSARDLEIHHLKPWAIGGTHEVTNLQILCPGHHEMKHEHRS
jgi:hypothetical protein